MLAGKNVEFIFDESDGSVEKKDGVVKKNGKVTLELLPEGGTIIISK